MVDPLLNTVTPGCSKPHREQQLRAREPEGLLPKV